MAARYEIEAETNAVFIYFDETTEPSLYQPHWPNGAPWASYEEAEAWAKSCIAAEEDASAPHAPNGPDEPGMKKITEEHAATLKILTEAMTKATTDEERETAEKELKDFIVVLDEHRRS